MTAITDRKRNLRELIVRVVERRIDEADDPDAKARKIALGACDRLAQRMTLHELEDWHSALVNGNNNA